MDKNRKRGINLKKIIFVIIVVAIIFSIIVIYLPQEVEGDYLENKRNIIFTKTQKPHPQLNKWKEKNQDIYAWLSIADTNIEYPVVMELEKEKGYYLNHDYEREESSYGSIYSEEANSPLLTDVQTVFYGHNMRDGSMFGSLEEFLKLDYFKEHREIKVHLEEETRKYEIIASYVYTNAHLLQELGTKKWTTKDYIDTVMFRAHEEGGNVWDGKIPDGTMLTLSTCHSADNSKRVLVQGVLKDVEKCE